MVSIMWGVFESAPPHHLKIASSKKKKEEKERERERGNPEALAIGVVWPSPLESRGRFATPN